MKMKNQIIGDDIAKDEVIDSVQQEETIDPVSNGGAVLHTIKDGDTFESIQKQYGVSYDEIKSLNRIGKVTNLIVGDKIRVK